MYLQLIREASEWGQCVANGTLLKAISHLNPRHIQKGTLLLGLIASHLTVIALSIPYVRFVTSGRFPVALALSRCTEPQERRCVWFIIGSITLPASSFCATPTQRAGKR